MAGATKKAIIIAISGCSSSGKTTLSRLLRDIFPNTFVLHEDDFYKPENELTTKHDLLDWDCAEAIDIESMKNSLEYIQKHGEFPPSLNSKEDQNSTGPCPISDSFLTTQKDLIKTHLTTHPLTTPIFILDGFLLYTPSFITIQPYLDLKLLLRVSYEKAKARREARSGYVTLEGFWEDPPGYVDKIVWPNYVEDHAFLFEDGDVEGVGRSEVLEEWGIRMVEGLDVEMEKMLGWAVGEVLGVLERKGK